MIVFKIKHVNHKRKTDFTIRNRFYNFIWSLFFRIWNEYRNILVAEFDVNRGHPFSTESIFSKKLTFLTP